MSDRLSVATADGAESWTRREILQQPETRQRYAAKARRYAEETFDLWRNGQQLAQLLFSSARLNREKTALLQTSPIRNS